MIHVIAEITATPDNRAALLAAFQELCPTVLAEVGCLAYTPTIDAADTSLAVQQKLGADVLVMVEQWDSVAALRDHLSAPHMHTFRQQHAHLIAGISLKVLTPG